MSVPQDIQHTIDLESQRARRLPSTRSSPGWGLLALVCRATAPPSHMLQVVYQSRLGILYISPQVFQMVFSKECFLILYLGLRHEQFLPERERATSNTLAFSSKLAPSALVLPVHPLKNTVWKTPFASLSLYIYLCPPLYLYISLARLECSRKSSYCPSSCTCS